MGDEKKWVELAVKKPSHHTVMQDVVDAAHHAALAMGRNLRKEMEAPPPIDPTFTGLARQLGLGDRLDVEEFLRRNSDNDSKLTENQTHDPDFDPDFLSALKSL